MLIGLMTDPNTHIYAEMVGQTFQGSQADLAVIALAQAVLNMGKSEQEKPIKLPNPYLGADKKTARAEYVAPQEKQRLSERLRSYSSIPE